MSLLYIAAVLKFCPVANLLGATVMDLFPLLNKFFQRYSGAFFHCSTQTLPQYCQLLLKLLHFLFKHVSLSSNLQKTYKLKFSFNKKLGKDVQTNKTTEQEYSIRSMYHSISYSHYIALYYCCYYNLTIATKSVVIIRQFIIFSRFSTLLPQGI